MRARHLAPCVLPALLFTLAPASAQESGAKSLTELRKGHTTTLTKRVKDEEPVPEPAPPFIKKVTYKGPLGEMSAWLTRPDHGGHSHPAIIWVAGGFPPGGMDESAWEPSDPDNDQSAKAWRFNDVITMYPWLRGSGGNPGQQEGFYGEVDDIVAAAKHLATVEGVDPERIYLGGHSTGGTLALLAAAAGFPFKAVIAFGPVADPADYGEDELVYDASDAKERQLRAPRSIINAITIPTLIIEGEGGNAESLEELRRAAANPKLTFAVIKGADHFSILSPLQDHLAAMLSGLAAGEAPRWSEASLNAAFADTLAARAEVTDLETLARVRAARIDIRAPQVLRYYLLARAELSLKDAVARAREAGFTADPIEAQRDQSGGVFYLVRIKRRVKLIDLEALFKASREARAVAEAAEVVYDDWDLEPKSD